jgi:hypothetical protein
MMSRLLSLCFPIVIFFSCTAPIDINTRDSELVIVIYGCLTDENRHQLVRVTSSSPYFDDKENGLVSDASVRIKDSEGNEYEMLYGENGYYFSESRFAVRPGITYHLRVDVDYDRDGTPETYEAATTIPPMLTMDSIAVKPISIMGFRHYSLNVFVQDPPETKDFYLFRFFINDSLSNNQISNYIVTDDEFFNGSYLENTVYYFEDITDENVVEKNRDNNNVYMVSPGDRIRLQVLSIEEGYYKFINECSSEMRGENPMFGGPPSNISTNLTNGAIGYFTGYCIYEMTTVVP